MPILIQRSEKIAGFLGIPQIEVDCELSPSIFNIYYNVERNLLIYNTLTKALLVIESDETTEHSANPSGKLKKLCENSYARTILAENRIMVPQTCDELSIYQELYDFLTALNAFPSGIERYNILTTTYCNARCFYCFEDWHKNSHMSLEVADAVSEYIQKSRRPSGEIYFRWFGGEPLVNKPAIDRICDNIREKDIPYFSSISSNGLLCNETLIEAIPLWHLKKIRISLDGYGEEHNRRKNFTNKCDAFSITVENIKKLSATGVPVIIRLNLDKNNLNSIQKLTDYLISIFSGNDNIAIYCKCLFDDISVSAAKNSRENVLSILKEQERIDQYLREHGIFDYERIAPIGYRTYFCAANNPHKVVILPDGKLCSCECHCSESVYWGDVWHGLTNPQEYEKWQKMELLPKCASCPFLPVCTMFSNCPTTFFDCKYRLKRAHEIFMQESFRRFRKKLPLLKIDRDISNYALCE